MSKPHAVSGSSLSAVEVERDELAAVYALRRAAQASPAARLSAAEIDAILLDHFRHAAVNRRPTR